VQLIDTSIINSFSVTHSTRMAPGKMAEKRDTAMIEDKDRDSVSLDKKL